MDENDKAKAGALPSDPSSRCAPANDKAKKRDAAKSRVLTVQKVMQQAFSDSCDRRNGKRQPCTSGNRRVDEITGGIQPGHVWVFGAETNWGKSSWELASADENLAVGKKVVIVTSEDDEGIYGSRLLSRRTKVPLTRIMRGQMNQDEYRLVAECVTRGEDQPFYVDARNKKIEDVAVEIDELVKAEAIDLVFWDYLQEFRSKRKFQDERVAFREIASCMRWVTKSNRIGGVILSQITVQTGKTYPDKHSIRECRDVSNAAEVVALGFTLSDDETVKRGNREVVIPKGTRCVLIDKNKTGPKPVLIDVEWDESLATFVSDVREDREAFEQSDSLDGFAEDYERRWP